MRSLLPARPLLPVGLLALASCTGAGETITTAGGPGQLDVRLAGEHAVRVTLKPLDYGADVPFTPALAEGELPDPAISLRTIGGEVRERVGSLDVVVRPDPLTVEVSGTGGRVVQRIVFQPDGTMTFRGSDQPILGLGEGGPMPPDDVEWRDVPVEFDRRGRMHGMRPRWQSNAYGSRNPVPVMIGTEGWGLFVATPWGEIDLSREDRGIFTPLAPVDDPESMIQNEENQQESLGKGLPPMGDIVPGLFDVFVFDASDPPAFMHDVSVITGPAVMPPKWTMGYMQSHRTLESDSQMVAIARTFRQKEIPADALIYLGTGFTPRGWNTEQPSFEFNPEVFRRDPAEVLGELQDLHFEVVLHMVPYDRDRIPNLHGSIPPAPGEDVGPGHIAPYWKLHEPLVRAGADGWWPDEGDWFDLWERMKRHELYYDGPLSTQPNVRPWALHRNGHLGVAKWGGWIWSGDPQSTWKTLEAQIAVGINHSLSLSPFWGSDIGGFYPTDELTGELYARWFQFGAFCAAFRAHGRTWWVRLPWGWGLDSFGPDEGPTPPASALNDPTIEPIARKYAELRYQLLSYNYTLAWQARSTGMPFIRALWLHYPDDPQVRGLGSEYLWGRDLLIAPVFRPGATSRELYLPEGRWYDWWTGEAQDGGRTVTRPVDLATMPIYARAGAIIPIDPVRQYTSQEVDGPLTLRVHQGADGEYTLYGDDGTSLDYLQGVASWTRMTWNDAARTLVIEPAPPPGSSPVARSYDFRVELVPDGETRDVAYAGERMEVTFE